MGNADLPLASGVEHVRAFERAGWVQLKRRGNGKHYLLKKTGVREMLSIPDHQTFLSEKGRDDGRDLVSAALAHLKRSGRAWRGGRSQWSTKPFPTDTSGPDKSGPEGDVITTGSGGDSHALLDQDHGDLLAGRNRDDRGGTPVGVLT